MKKNKCFCKKSTSHNLSVDEFVVKLIYSFLHSQPKKKRFKMLPLEELSPEIQDIMSIPMIGKIDANDVNADEARAECYKEKYPFL